jgi:hypothetical protein
LTIFLIFYKIQILNTQKTDGDFMTRMLQTVLFSITFLFASFASAYEEPLNNSVWGILEDNMSTYTIFSGNPYAGEEGVILGTACVKKNNSKMKSMTFIVGDGGSLPKQLSDSFNMLTSDGSVLHNKDLGLKLTFSDSSVYVYQFVRTNQKFKNGVIITELTLAVSDEVVDKFKRMNWVDVDLFANGEAYSMFKPFRLKGSMAAINKISGCYDDF